jgi:hypothetical protein
MLSAETVAPYSDHMKRTNKPTISWRRSSASQEIHILQNPKVFSRSYHLSIFWGRLMQSQPSHFNIILSSTNTYFKRLFIAAKILHAFLISPTHVTFPAYFTLLESNKLIIFGYVWGTGEMHKGFCWKTLWNETI